MLKELHYYSNTTTNQPSGRKVLSTKDTSTEITISFVGELKENIEHMLNQLECTQDNRSQIRHILHCYADKITKLRQQRDHYKQLLLAKEEQHQQQLSRLKSQLTDLEQQLLRERARVDICCCPELQDNCFEEFTSQHDLDECCCQEQYGDHEDSNISNQKLRESHRKTEHKHCRSNMFTENKEQELLISNAREPTAKDQTQSHQSVSWISQVESRQVKTISEEEMLRMMIKFNLGMEDLAQILQEYEGSNQQLPPARQMKQQAALKPHNKHNQNHNKCSRGPKKQLRPNSNSTYH